MGWLGEKTVTRRAEVLLSSGLDSIKPRTAQEYFTVLLDRALQASRAGDYGISAALVVRYDDMEFISIGRNTAISQRDPLGHAEANAIKAFRHFLGLDQSERIQQAVQWGNLASVIGTDTAIFVRSVDSHRSQAQSAPRSLLYTTLEPCPMCTVAIMNSRIEHVIIASSDESTGVLDPERLARLPSTWPQFAAIQNLQVTFLNTTKDRKMQITTDLKALLTDVFSATKDYCNAAILQGVLFLSNDEILNSLHGFNRSPGEPIGSSQ